jgi:hypothetical protein
MSTIIHPDGVKTIAHTSHFREKQHADWLRRQEPGPNGEQMARDYLTSCREAEAQTHAAEYERALFERDRMAGA